MFEPLAFRHPFRTYQRQMLSRIEAREGTAEDDGRYHLVAPPGSGKTIVGLELIRRFGAPAVVFAPTTVIQRQWREQVGMFTDDRAQVERLTSLDPDALSAINVFTYQLISTVGESREEGRRMAEDAWAAELVREGQSDDDAAARERIRTLAANNAEAHRREVAHRYLRLKRELLRGPDASVAEFLHPNARALVDRLVAHGVRTIVLDECHHLLDYWAIVLRHLIGRIAEPRVIGLTATLPSPEDDEEYENYTALLGEVDFEVPTPAVVKEGDLAPYRSLVCFVEPSRRETAYLRDIQRSFESAVQEISASDGFVGWVRTLVLERPSSPRDPTPVPWERFLDEHALLAVAGIRFLRRSGVALPPDLLVPQEAEGEMQLEDWIALLERYALDVLKVSADAEDHRRLAALRRALLPFGLTLSERGLRQGRSPGDLVLALSESKDVAAAEILTVEERHLGERLRAVVVTDYERLSAGVARLTGVLERDAGSAARVFRHLVAAEHTGRLEPILVTGKGVLVDADHGPALLERFNAYLADAKLDARVTYSPTDTPGVAEVQGDGRDWTSGTYVRMVTAAFEAGVTRCLVGTRGIFGEGWDTLRLNTLIDLTSVTTSTSVQQLRGRTIRKDAEWPHKVAHDWDVVCVARDFERGDSDLRRFVRRHEQLWGIVAATGKEARSAAVATGIDITVRDGSAEGVLLGQVVKGVAHVDHDLAYQLATRPFRSLDLAPVNTRMLRAVEDREATWALWRVGDDYTNFVAPVTRLQPADLDMRSVFTLRATLKRMLASLIASIGVGVALVLWVVLALFGELAGSGSEPGVVSLVVGVALAIGLAVVLMLNLRGLYRYARAYLLEQPPDHVLRDIGRAILVALRECGLVQRSMEPGAVVVVALPDGSYQVLLEGAVSDDADTFTTAYRECFEAPRDQRYLVERTEARMLGISPLWAAARRGLRARLGTDPIHFPVPSVLGTRRDRAEAFELAWRQYVGEGRLIATRSEEGRAVLLRARAQRRPKMRSLAFDRWT